MKTRIFTFLALFAIIALLFVSCTEKDDEVPENTAPTASFTIDPPAGNTQTEFLLDASASSDNETPAADLLVRWDGNDDGIWETDFSTTKTAQVTFENDGTYNIRLEVKDGGGLIGTTTQQLIVGSNLAPDAPANPNPEDGATDIPINVSLQWSASDPDQDPMTFDVYFGNVQNPPLASAGIGTNSYDPGMMANNTTYYWKIVVHDNQDHSTEGAVWSFTTSVAAFSCGDIVTDPRDGKTYPTVQIVDQCWMAKNMNIGNRIDGSLNMSDNASIEKYCYDNDDANCNEFGGLYQWDEMLQYGGNSDKGICPDGWHIPSLAEWQELEIALGMTVAQATATSGYQGTNQGTQLKEGGTSGFEALLGGYRSNSGSFTTIGLNTAFWTATQSSSFVATARSLDSGHAQVNHTNYDKRLGHAVRCVMN